MIQFAVFCVSILARVVPRVRFYNPTHRQITAHAGVTGTQGTKGTQVFYTEFVASLTALSSLLSNEGGIYFTSNKRVPLLR